MIEKDAKAALHRFEVATGVQVSQTHRGARPRPATDSTVFSVKVVSLPAVHSRPPKRDGSVEIMRSSVI